MTRPFRYLCLTAPLALALVAACSSSSTKLSMSARSGTATAAAAAPQGRTTRLAAGGGVNLTRVRMVIEEVRLDPVEDGGSGGSSDGGADGGAEDHVILGPYLLDMSGTALDSGLTQVFDADAVPGTYRRIRFKIHKLSGGDPQFQDMANLSIKLEGTDSNGAPFTWTSTLDEEQRLEGTFVIQDGSSSNVTLAIDTSGWFLNGNQPIDPHAADGTTAHKTVEDNIRASIEAPGACFDDDNHDGRHD